MYSIDVSYLSLKISLNLVNSVHHLTDTPDLVEYNLGAIFIAISLKSVNSKNVNYS